MKDKHKAPLWCRIRRSIVGYSPSAVLAKCSLGLKNGCKGCKNCENNRRETIVENFQKGLSEGISERQKLEIENFIYKEFNVPPKLKEELTKCNT